MSCLVPKKRRFLLPLVLAAGTACGESPEVATAPLMLQTTYDDAIVRSWAMGDGLIRTELHVPGEAEPVALLEHDPTGQGLLTVGETTELSIEFSEGAGLEVLHRGLHTIWAERTKPTTEYASDARVGTSASALRAPSHYQCNAGGYGVAVFDGWPYLSQAECRQAANSLCAHNPSEITAIHSGYWSGGKMYFRTHCLWLL